MSIKIEFHGNIALIALSGALDYSTRDEIQEANNQALSADHVKEIEVDFADVTFLDSSIIRALIMLKMKATTAGRSLVLLNCGDPVMEIFNIGGFDMIFTIRN